MVSSEVVKIFALVLVWCSMGLDMEIAGPTLIDVRLIFNASYEEVSRSVSGRGAGGFTGALIGGFLVDKFSHSLDLLVGVSETAAAFAILSLPFSPTINTVWFHYFVLGICGNVNSIAGIRTVITMWPKKTTVVLHVLHIGYGLGALIVPIFVNPFLAVIRETNVEQGEGNGFTVIKETRVQRAFVAFGVFTFVVSAMFYYFHMNSPKGQGYSPVQNGSDKPKTQSKSFLEAINPATYANGQFTYGLIVIVLMCIYFFNMAGGEEMFAHFIRSFSVEIFKFSRTEASYLNMLFWLGITISRLVSAVTANYVSTRRLFMVQIVLHACSTTLLNMYASSSRTMLWVCTFLEGFLISPLYPGGIAYVSTLIEVTGVCLMVVALAGSLGDLTYIWVAGKLVDTYGPSSVLYGLQFVGVLLLVITLVFKVTERFKLEPSTEVVVHN